MEQTLPLSEFLRDIEDEFKVCRTREVETSFGKFEILSQLGKVI
jgi:hypothetical protein